MPQRGQLLTHGNRRSQQAGNAGVVGKLDYRIGNATDGQGVYLTGTEQPIAVGSVPANYDASGLQHIASAAIETSHVLLAAAGQLYRFSYNNGNGATRYLQLFNAKALPANGAVPYCTPVPVLTGQTVNIDYGALGLPFPTGIVIANSTTAASLTIGSAVGFFSAEVF